MREKTKLIRAPKPPEQKTDPCRGIDVSSPGDEWMNMKHCSGCTSATERVNAMDLMVTEFHRVAVEDAILHKAMRTLAGELADAIEIALEGKCPSPGLCVTCRMVLATAKAERMGVGDGIRIGLRRSDAKT